VETHIIAQDQEVQKRAFCLQNDDVILGLVKHYQNHEQTVSSAEYCAILGEELKCREVLTNGVVLHHDNLKTEI
jgi:hypothetical protein